MYLGLTNEQIAEMKAYWLAHHFCLPEARRDRNIILRNCLDEAVQIKIENATESDVRALHKLINGPAKVEIIEN